MERTRWAKPRRDDIRELATHDPTFLPAVVATLRQVLAQDHWNIDAREEIAEQLGTFLIDWYRAGHQPDGRSITTPNDPDPTTWDEILRTGTQAQEFSARAKDWEQRIRAAHQKSQEELSEARRQAEALETGLLYSHLLRKEALATARRRLNDELAMARYQYAAEHRLADLALEALDRVDPKLREQVVNEWDGKAPPDVPFPRKYRTSVQQIMRREEAGNLARAQAVEQFTLERHDQEHGTHYAQQNTEQPEDYPLDEDPAPTPAGVGAEEPWTIPAPDDVLEVGDEEEEDPFDAGLTMLVDDSGEAHWLQPGEDPADYQ